MPSGSDPTDDLGDFTIENYQRLLRLARAAFQFADFSEIPYGSRFVLWRHDCDISLGRALRMAEIEYGEGIQSTFFVNLHSDYYNPLEISQARIIQKVVGLEHRLGLHFDPLYYEELHGVVGIRELEEHIESERRILEDCFGTDLAAVSFHNPARLISDLGDEKLGGLVNCYSDRIRNQISYVSDSNGYWRFKSLEEALRDSGEQCLQVLTHPVWWQERPMVPWHRVLRSVDGRRQATLNAYEDALSKDGRLNLGRPERPEQCLTSSVPAAETSIPDTQSGDSGA